MKNLNMYFSSFLVFCFLSLTSLVSMAQTGTITGQVVDDENNPVIGATVAVDGTTLGALADANGNFTIKNVKVGTYKVAASFVGYKKLSQEVNVTAGGTATANFTLKEDLLGLDEIVVSGTFNPQSKLESTVSVTTLNSDLIEQQAPRSTTDLIDAIPGFYAESSQGESGANIYPRGLPIGTGSFRYVGVREDGLPTFEVPDKVFFNADGYTRADLTIETLEGLRGGNAAIFSSNTPAGIINFRTKTGGPEAAGEAKLTYGTQGMLRLDMNFGGPLSSDKKWRYNIGGFYRYDEGLRDFTGPANQGGQFKMNFTRLFDDNKGYFRISGKVLRDEVAFWTPVPYLDNNDPKPLPGGPDLTSGTMIPSGERDALVGDPYNPGATRRTQFAPGNTINYQNIGTELNLDLGDGWKLLNQTRFMSGGQRSGLFILTSNPISGQGLFFSAAAANPALGALQQNYFYVNPAPVNGVGINYTPGATTGEAIDASSLSLPAVLTGADNDILTTGLNGNGLLLPMLQTIVDVRAQNFINNLQISKTIAENHNITFGGYLSSYDVDEFWDFSAFLTDVRSNPRLVEAQLLVPNTDIVAFEFTRDGVISQNAQLERSNSQNLTYAGFFGYEGTFAEKLTLTLGLRLERNNAKGSLQNTRKNTAAGGIDGNLATNWDATGDIFTNSFTNYNLNHEVWNGTIGLNYKITEDMAVFGNFTRGTRYSNSQNFLANKDQFLPDGSPFPIRNNIEEVLQGEVGYRWASPKFGLAVSTFWTQLSDTPFTIQESLPSGDIVLNAVFFDARTIGAEIEAVYSPIKGLRFDAAVSIQDAKYTNYSPVTVFDIETNDALTLDFSDNQIERIPPISFDLTGSYTFSDFNIYLNWRYVGEREGNRRNTYKLAAFSEFGAGASYTLNKKITFAVQVINLFDSQGIIQGNTRTQDRFSAAIANNPNTISTGDFILPRSANFSIHYKF